MSSAQTIVHVFGGLFLLMLHSSFQRKEVYPVAACDWVSWLSVSLVSLRIPPARGGVGFRLLDARGFYYSPLEVSSL